MNFFPKDRSSRIIFLLGIFTLIYYLIDIGNVIFLMHKPAILLWYSCVVLGLTASALLSRNTYLICVMFVAMMIPELIWCLGFFSNLLIHTPIPGVAEYDFQPNYPTKDFIVSLYHFATPAALAIAVFNIQKVHKKAWIGAIVYASTLAFLTYFLTSKSDNINCIYNVDLCRSFVSFLYKQFDNPLRVFVGLIFLTFLVYLPTNYFLLWLKRHPSKSEKA
jgi:hypothetical protein